jgi:UDP-glucose 4-epimerase
VKPLRDARVLITGGLGFIGSRLAIRLAEGGSDVTVVDDMVPNTGANPLHLRTVQAIADVRTGNIGNVALIREAVEGRDYLFNLAALVGHVSSMRQPLDDLDVNARAQLTLLEACRELNPGVRIVHASTRQVYGRPHYLPVDEDHPVAPPDVNGINKLAGELYHQLYHRVYGVRSTVLRLTNTYGPGMRIRDGRLTFLGVWVRSVLEGTPFQVWGGAQMRDLTWVEDQVDALCVAATTEDSDGAVFNVGGTESVSLLQLAKLLIAANDGVGSYELAEFPEEHRRIDIGDFVADDRRFRTATGWRPTTTLEDGLRATLAYYREHLRDYV